MNTKKISFLKIILLLFSSTSYATYDINLIGFLNDIKSVSRHTTSFIDCLPREYKQIKLFQTKTGSAKDLTTRQKSIHARSVDLRNPYKLYGQIRAGLQLSGISICTEHLWYPSSWKAYKSIPDNSIIRYHYCVTERTEIPRTWRDKFNKNFDAIIVADDWLVEVYQKSGVKIPIFTLPLAIELNSLLSKPIKKRVLRPFIFGISAVFHPRKNHPLLLRAFHEEFKNDKNVKLIIHGRFESPYLKRVQKIVKDLGSNNIKVFAQSFSRKEYENFIAELDCYTLLSKGEGYSITPREALALGIPCILSNNTAHKTICESNLVYAVPSNKAEPSYCSITGLYLGNEFNCEIADVRKALRNVYTNYSEYLTKAHAGREWVKQYLPKNLQRKYLNLVKPKKVIFGPKNEITDDYLMTNSKVLFEKYKQLCKSEKTQFEVTH